jgi:hypothetical protein
MDALGLCKTHYRNERARTLVPDEPDKQCTRDGCPRVRMAHGLCKNHYWTERKKLPAKPGQRGCEVEGCERVHLARGYCRRHYSQWYNAQTKAGTK